jgi:probable addiction module antidote protein
MAVKIAPFDAAEVLDTEEAIEEFIAAFIAKCLGIVARARNMSRLAEEIGMSRPALYRAERRGQPGVRDHRQGHARAWAQAGPRQGNTSTGYQATAETGRPER